MAPRIGTRYCHSQGCQHQACRAVVAKYQRGRYKLVQQGRWDGYRTNPTEARTHIQTLKAQGFTLEEIGDAAGIGYDQAWRIWASKPKYIFGSTADAILGCNPARRPDGKYLYPGAARRVQALMRLGWHQRAIATAAGIDAHHIRTVLNGSRIPPATYTAVVAVYDALWDQTPADTTDARRAKTQAEKAGWALPAEWDDDAIDLPNARPHIARGGTSQLGMTRPETLDRMHDLARLVDEGHTDAEIAPLLGYPSRSAVRSARNRAGITRTSKEDAA